MEYNVELVPKVGGYTGNNIIILSDDQHGFPAYVINIGSALQFGGNLVLRGWFRFQSRQ